MKGKSKVKTIIDAWTSGKDVGDDIFSYRLEKCLSCPFSSDNADKPITSDFPYKIVPALTTVQKARKVVDSKPFCVLCGCPVDKKASRSESECELGNKGEVPRWNSIRAASSSNVNIDIVNYEHEKASFKIGGGEYVIDLGVIADVVNLRWAVVSPRTFTISYMRPSCNTCTSFKFNRASNTVYDIDMSIDPTNFPNGKFTKKIFIGYVPVNSTKIDTTILIKGIHRNEA